MSTAATPTPATPEFGLHRIRQIAVVVRDVDRAVRFYRETLGIRFLFQPQPTLAFFECDGIRLMLTLPEEPEAAHGSSILYYAVADIQHAHATLSARGVAFVDAPHPVARMSDHDLWLAVAHDSEGNLLGIMSEVPR